MSSRRLTVLVAVSSLALLLPLLLLPRLAHAQGTASPPRDALGDRLRVPDSLHSQVMQLRDGSTLVGRITEVRADSVAFATAVASVVLPRSAIVEVREI